MFEKDYKVVLIIALILFIFYRILFIDSNMCDTKAPVINIEELSTCDPVPCQPIDNSIVNESELSLKSDYRILKNEEIKFAPLRDRRLVYSPSQGTLQSAGDLPVSIKVFMKKMKITKKRVLVHVTMRMGIYFQKIIIISICTTQIDDSMTRQR